MSSCQRAVKQLRIKGFFSVVFIVFRKCNNANNCTSKELQLDLEQTTSETRRKTSGTAVERP